MLKVSSVSAAYGPIRALHDVSLEVGEGQIVTLLGANGAGKSSTLRVISGVIRPTSGSVEFLGQRIHHRSPERIVSLGISHVPEGRELFTELTVAENLSLGAYTRRDRDGIRQDLDRAYQYFPLLAQRREQHAGSLSGGEQQMLAIARGLMSRPRLLLLDEPSLGLAPLVVKEIFKIIDTINREEKVTILLVEQNASMALSIAAYAYVLETGRIVLADTGSALKDNETVRRSYLGY
jgi:branched-chain amino acid transport system ATP-binding protein